MDYYEGIRNKTYGELVLDSPEPVAAVEAEPNPKHKGSIERMSYFKYCAKITYKKVKYAETFTSAEEAAAWLVEKTKEFYPNKY